MKGTCSHHVPLDEECKPCEGPDWKAVAVALRRAIPYCDCKYPGCGVCVAKKMFEDALLDKAGAA